MNGTTYTSAVKTNKSNHTRQQSSSTKHNKSNKKSLADKIDVIVNQQQDNNDNIKQTNTAHDNTMLLKPLWVKHDDTGSLLSKNLPIYCIDIDHTNTRCATGGSDKKIKIWSMNSIYNDNNNTPVSKTSDAVSNQQQQQLLCLLTQHQADINTLKFAHNSNMLATGSDGHQNRSVIIYELNNIIKPQRQLGSDYVAVENWVVKYSISCHDSDVLDMSWSYDDKLLATCSVDNYVYIININNGNIIHKFKAANDWIKSVSFDPLNNYLACMSTGILSIFDINNNYELVHSIEEPYLHYVYIPVDGNNENKENNKKAGWVSRYIKQVVTARISWSADGMQISTLYHITMYLQLLLLVILTYCICHAIIQLLCNRFSYSINSMSSRW